ncbi:MAG: TatD family hydrolase [bacterium]|nr:TatD family hydrolase [bacterium]
MIDSHVHLNRSEFAGDRDAVMAAARAEGVTGFLNVGYDLPTSRESVVLAETHADVWATVGVHPHDAQELADADGKLVPKAKALLTELAELARHPRVVAVGEIGLDFFRDLSPRPAQRTALAAQLELAAEVDLPVIFHVRDAWQEILVQVDECGVPARGGVLHAFAGGPEAVVWARERGLLLGIGGPVTYKNSTLPDRVAEAGADMLLLETDAPWLPPVPYRGKRNEPGYVRHTRDKVAQLLDMTPGEVGDRTTANFRRLFGAAP